MIGERENSEGTNIEIPGLPKGFARMVAAVQGRDLSADNDLKLAEGQNRMDIFMYSYSATNQPASQPINKHEPLHEQGHLGPKGIYLGVWPPVDNQNKDLGKVFDVYAAPTDLTQPRSMSGATLHTHFNAAVDAVAALKNWHHYDGARIESDKQLYNLIRQGRYDVLEKWFIPPKELLHSGSVSLKGMLPPNLRDSSEKKAFKGTFIREPHARHLHRHWYWSISESLGNPDDVYLVNFERGKGQMAQTFPKDREAIKATIRPIRMEPRL